MTSLHESGNDRDIVSFLGLDFCPISEKNTLNIDLLLWGEQGEQMGDQAKRVNTVRLPEDLVSLVPECARRKGESAYAYQAFLTYLSLESRGITKAWRVHWKGTKQEHSQVSGSWWKWSGKNEWVSRAAAYDRVMWNKRMQEARMRVIRVAPLWAQDELDEIEETRRVAGKLRDRAEQMLKWPLEKKVVQSDGAEYHIYPAKWSVGTAIRAYEVAQQLTQVSNKEAERLIDALFGSREGMQEYIDGVEGESSEADPRMDEYKSELDHLAGWWKDRRQELEQSESSIPSIIHGD